MQKIVDEQSKNLASLTDDLTLLETGFDCFRFTIPVARLDEEPGCDPLNHMIADGGGRFVSILYIEFTGYSGLCAYADCIDGVYPITCERSWSPELKRRRGSAEPLGHRVDG